MAFCCVRIGLPCLPPATIEALEHLSNSHMYNSLQYATAQVGPSMVVVARRLCKVISDSSELSFVRSKRDDLRAKLLEFEKEKHAFEECYDLLDG